jgi:protein-disulfide isomerase
MRLVTILFYLFSFSLCWAQSLPQKVLGNPAAPLLITMYYSLDCPHCKEFEETTLKEIHEKYIQTGLVYLTIHDFPLTLQAVKATCLARCDGTLETYEKRSHLLLMQQEEWFDQEEKLFDFATHKLGMTPEECQQCIKQWEIAVMQQRVTDQNAYKIQFAPAFFINGAPLDHVLTVEDIEEALKDHNAQKSR